MFSSPYYEVAVRCELPRRHSMVPLTGRKINNRNLVFTGCVKAAEQKKKLSELKNQRKKWNTIQNNWIALSYTDLSGLPLKTTICITRYREMFTWFNLANIIEAIFAREIVPFSVRFNQSTIFILKLTSIVWISLVPVVESSCRCAEIIVEIIIPNKLLLQKLLKNEYICLRGWVHPSFTYSICIF